MTGPRPRKHGGRHHAFAAGHADAQGRAADGPRKHGTQASLDTRNSTFPIVGSYLAPPPGQARRLAWAMRAGRCEPRPREMPEAEQNLVWNLFSGDPQRIVAAF